MRLTFWLGKFKRGKTSLEDEARSGRCPLTATDVEMCKAARMGQLAVDFLIQGADEIKSGSKYFRYFKKPGDYNKAFHDFKSVDPNGVTTFNWQGVEGLIGTVGDRSIILKSKGATGKPTMEIIKRDKLTRMTIPSSNPSLVSDIITYME